MHNDSLFPDPSEWTASHLFQSKRGLPEGCAAPYLFVICMNVLSLLTDKTAIEIRIGFHPKCKNINLAHLCFADDLMVFVDDQRRSVEGIMKVFGEFAVPPGLKISTEKSTIYLAGVLDQNREDLLATFPFKHGHFPVKYLGLPLLTMRMTKSQDYEPLFQKNKMQNESMDWFLSLIASNSFFGRYLK